MEVKLGKSILGCKGHAGVGALIHKDPLQRDVLKPVNVTAVLETASSQSVDCLYNRGLTSKTQLAAHQGFKSLSCWCRKTASRLRSVMS